MILNTFNVQKTIETIIGGFDDSIYIIDYTTNQVKLSINSVFDWESLADKLNKTFPQADFEFTTIGLDLTISW